MTSCPLVCVRGSVPSPNTPACLHPQNYPLAAQCPMRSQAHTLCNRHTTVIQPCCTRAPFPPLGSLAAQPTPLPALAPYTENGLFIADAATPALQDAGAPCHAPENAKRLGVRLPSAAFWPARRVLAILRRHTSCEQLRPAPGCESEKRSCQSIPTALSRRKCSAPATPSSPAPRCARRVPLETHTPRY